MMRKTILQKTLLSCLLMLALFAVPGFQKEQKRYEASFLDLFDTVSLIIGYDTDKDAFTAFSQKTHDALAEYHQLYDIYHDDAAVSIKTINDNAGIAPVKVDQRIISLLQTSREINRITNGKTNVAMGAVLRIWHKYREEGIDDPSAARLPPMDMLQEAALHINIDDMIIDEDASTVYLQDPQMSLDVGAIAKGYATEQVAAAIQRSGTKNVLLSIGGNVRAIGSKPDGSPWGVAIQNPDKEAEQDRLFTLNISGLSVVTSGAYQRYYTVDGVAYSHIIDPDTLMPATYFSSVSIVTENSGLADGLSTALFCMPLDAGKALVTGLGTVEACWVLPDGTIEMTDGFAAMIKNQS